MDNSTRNKVVAFGILEDQTVETDEAMRKFKGYILELTHEERVNLRDSIRKYLGR